MSFWRHVTRGFATLLRREATEKDLADEIDHFLEEELADRVARGESGVQARRSIRLAHGDRSWIREEARSYGWERHVEAWARDLRYAARRLRASPGFTFIATSTLALGIGAATAIFSVAKPVLFDPLAYPEGGRLMWVSDRGADGSAMPIAFGTYREVLIRARSFESLSVFRPWQPVVTEGGDPERLDGQLVSASYFRVLGVAPALGPGFDASNDYPQGEREVILSDGLWRSRFGGDGAIIGRPVRLDGATYTVVGVMPAGFRAVRGENAAVWSLLRYDAALPSFEGREWGHHLSMVARLAPGVDAAMAQQELDQVAAQPVAELSRPTWAAMDPGLVVRPLKQVITAIAKPVLVVLMGAVALLLGITCVNVAGLSLTRGAHRRREVSLRLALGAARSRVVRTLLMESVVVAAVAGGLAGVVAWFGVRGLALTIPIELQLGAAVGLDWGVFGGAIVLTAALLVGAGMWPAVRVARAANRLRPDAAGGPAQHRLSRRAFVVTEVALALVLLVGAGLMLRTARGLFAVPIGFETAQRVVLQVQTVGPEFADAAYADRFFAQVLDRIGEVPAVSSVAYTSQLPLSGDLDSYGVAPEEVQSTEGFGAAYRYSVSPSYVEAMGVPLRHGRFLEDSDVAGAPKAVVVSESLAKSAYGDAAAALGKRIHVGRPDLDPYTIVGVVGDVRQESLEAGDANAAYVTPQQWYFVDGARWLIVHTREDARGVIDAVKQAIWSIDGDVPVIRAALFQDLVTGSEARRRFALFILGVFAAFALLLAGLGLYGMLAANVYERTREIGIRSALGATHRRIVGLIVRQGLSLTALGAVLGLGAAATASTALTTLLYDVSRLDPLTYAGMTVLITGVAALACWVPAARAARVDPALTLKTE